MATNGMTQRGIVAFWLLLLWPLVTITIYAQGTAFTYQGKLTDSATPASGQYDFQFKLFDTDTVGTGAQQGSTLTHANVAVSGGVFTVQLDFGVCAGCFNGSARFLEIAVKPTVGSTYTTLEPRQSVTATPYAIKSQNATTADGLSVACISCVTDTQIASVAGDAITGMIPVSSVPSGSTSYIQNTTSEQVGASFNIDGSGTAEGTLSGNIVNATTQFNLNGSRILSDGGANNLFAGVGAGTSNTGLANAFFGPFTGQANTSGGGNSFFGNEAGSSNTTGSNNSFFGDQAGINNTSSSNSFYGSSAGVSNTAGNENSFFGRGAGQGNTIGSSNSFFGRSAGSGNTTGIQNSSLGSQAGSANTTGSNNSYFGAFANSTDLLTNATSIGFRALVTQNHSLVLGGINGVNGCTPALNCDSVKVGIGTTAPAERLHVVGSGLFAGNLTINGNLMGSFTVPVGNGGTGLTSAGSAGTFLRSNGSVWASSLIQPADLPDLSSSYIRNAVSQQAGASFNISGNGTTGGTLSGNIVSATTQYNLAGVRMLVANGPFDSGVGLNVSASNSFLGESAGLNTAPNPMLNSGEGKNNSFVGAAAGEDNTTGSSNSFLGVLAGAANTTGIGNSFFGVQAGVGNSTGSNNTAIGLFANVGSNNLTNATAVGARARVDQSNSLVLGSINGVNGAAADTNVGIGTTAPINLLTIGQPETTVVTGRVGVFGPSGLNVVVRETTNDVEGIFGVNSSSGVIYGSMTNHAVRLRTNNINRITIASDGNVGIGTTAPDQLLTVNGGASKPGGGSWAVFSDQRLKTVKGGFSAGLNEVTKLQPIRYEYKPDNALGIRAGGEQIGFAAQAVERVIPEAVTRNEQGYLLVNNDPIMWAMLNAIKELRLEKDKEIAALKSENDSLKQRLGQMSHQEVLLRQQQIQIDSIKKLVCLGHPDADACK